VVFSRANLQDMRRFHDVFEIRQPLGWQIGTCRDSPRHRLAKSETALILSPVDREPSERLLIDFRKSTIIWDGRITGYCSALRRFGKRRFYFERACVERLVQA